MRAIRWNELSEEEIKEKLENIGKTFYCKNCNNIIESKRIDSINFCSRKCHGDYAIKELMNKKKICYDFLEECKKK